MRDDEACFGPSWAQTLLSLELAKSSLENREVRTHVTLIWSWKSNFVNRFMECKGYNTI